MSEMPHEEFSSEDLMSFINGLKDGSIPMSPTQEQSQEDKDTEEAMALIDQSNMPEEAKDALRDVLKSIHDMSNNVKKEHELVKRAQELAKQDVASGNDPYCKLLSDETVANVLMLVETSPIHRPTDKLRMIVAIVITALKDNNIQL